jgi:hypothetical protein
MSPAKKKQKDTSSTSFSIQNLKAPTEKMQPRPTLLKPALPVPNGHEVAVRAYELFIERGGQHGNDWEDWFNAEQQLTAGR